MLPRTFAAGLSQVNPNRVSRISITPAGSDLDNNFPKIEARYTLNVGGFTFIPFGGFQYFKVSATDTTEAAATLTDDLDIYSYVLGGVAKFNIGAAYINLEGAWGQNWSNANWDNGANPWSLRASSANLDGTDDVSDATSWLVGASVGLNFTPQLKFELGAAWTWSDGKGPYSMAEEWDVTGEYAVSPLSLNAVYRIPAKGMLSPYITAGLTYFLGTVKLETTRGYGFTWKTEDSQSLDYLDIPLRIGKSIGAFGGNAGAGVDIRLGVSNRHGDAGAQAIVEDDGPFLYNTTALLSDSSPLSAQEKAIMPESTDAIIEAMAGLFTGITLPVWSASTSPVPPPC